MSDDRPLIVGLLKARNEVVRESNIHRALANMAAFCDLIVACDDASNDETCAALAAHPKVVSLLQVNPALQDFRRELEIKQVMLEAIHRLKPYWVWWHDADEELVPEGVAAIRAFCEAHKKTGVPAFRFHYDQLWRSDQWIRTDAGFAEGAFIKLWRWRPELSFDIRPGTHHAQFPKQLLPLLPLIPLAPWPVLHWGNYGANLRWKCIMYYGGLGGVDRHLKFEQAIYAPSCLNPQGRGIWPAPFMPEEQALILEMQGLRRTPGWFTVVIPAFNRAATLPRALESLLAQTYPKWVALVLDDGSTDNTPALMWDWQERDPRIFYARYAENRGGVAMNELGMALSEEWTEFWTRLGSDDTFGPNKLALDAQAFAQGPAVEAVYGPYQVVRNGAKMETCNVPLKPSLTKAALFNGIFAASWANIAVRGTALARVRKAWGRFADPRLRNMEDFLVNARIGWVTDGFHFRGIRKDTGAFTFVDTDATADALGDPRMLRETFEPDGFWSVAADGASSNTPVTGRDEALTRVIIKEDQARQSPGVGGAA